MKESVHDKKYDNTRRLDDVKEAKGPDDNNDKFDEEQDERYHDVPSPVYMEEGDEQDDNTEKLDEIKESKVPGIIHTIDMEECVGKKTSNKNDRMDEETSEDENSDSVIPTVNDTEGKSLTKLLV